MDRVKHREALLFAAHKYERPSMPMFSFSVDDNQADRIEAAFAEYLERCGMKVVPAEPTKEMYFKSGTIHDFAYWATQYQEMLAAFPSPFDEVK